MTLLLQYMLMFASVLLLVALGGCFSEHSGVINPGLEGVMIMGALGGALAMRYMPTGSSAFSMLIVVLLAAAYVAYVFISYHRIGDQPLTPVQTPDTAPSLSAGEAYTLVSWNIGFGAYEEDYGFFMDGGTESRAWSKERLTANMDAIAGYLKQQDADFYLLQEVDTDATRSYHVDEREPLYAALFDKSSVFCQNYDSPYLLYPLTKPHGASQSGLLTFAPVNIAAANRVELPVEGGFMKLLDLDRCYSVSRIPAEGGKELVLYDLHLSAYTSDGTKAAVVSTYHSVEDGWYLRLPDVWKDQILITRTAGTEEVTVTFSYRGDSGEPPQDVLRITKLTGSGREARATRGGRVILRRLPEIIYTAELLDTNGSWEYGLTEDEVREAFSLITTEWSAGDS